MRANNSSRILAYAAMGLTLTVLGSLAPLLWAHRGPSDGFDSGSRRWPVSPPQGWPPAPNHNYSDQKVGWFATALSSGLDKLAESKRTDPSITAHIFLERRSGLPFLAVRRIDMNTQVMRTITQVQLPWWRKGLPSPAWFANGYAVRERIPIEPLPLGFIANWFFYTTLVACTARAWQSQKQKRRTSKGLCPICAYQRTPPTCPECGHAFIATR